MIHDILDNAVSKWVGNTACIIASLLILLLGSIVKSALPITPFFKILKTVPPSEACLYGCIN